MRPGAHLTFPWLCTHRISLFGSRSSLALQDWGTLKSSMVQQTGKEASVLIPASAEMIRHNKNCIISEI